MTRSRPRSAPPQAGPPPASIPPAIRLLFGRRLRHWYRRHARDLPWRRTRDPYEVLVSELMLQQTQVSRVLLRYGEFLERFPTLHHVAAVPVAQAAAEEEPNRRRNRSGRRSGLGRSTPRS